MMLARQISALETTTFQQTIKYKSILQKGQRRILNDKYIITYKHILMGFFLKYNTPTQILSHVLY